MRQIVWAGIVAVLLSVPAMAKSGDLQDAFHAALEQEPPAARVASLPELGTRVVSLPKVGETVVHLDPVAMVHIGATRVALIISESFDGGYWAHGDIAVAYLDRDPTGWRPVKVWYEFAQSGSFGRPFNGQKVLSFNFGGTPFFAGEGALCGMGGCTRWYDLIGFSPDRPMDWGWIDASGFFDPKVIAPNGSSLTDSGGMTGCGGYEYSSVISAPKNRGDVMRVTYTGWMMPGGKGQKRKDFQFSSELSLTGVHVNFRPDGKLPNCGS